MKHPRTLILIVATAALAASLWITNAQDRLFPQPSPGPAPTPAEELQSTSPMEELAKPQNYSASRASSYNREGGPRDNYWIPTSGEEITLADLKGPGAITHIWTTHRGDGHDLIIRIYWEGSEHPSVEAPIGDFFGVATGVNANMNSTPIQVSSEGRSRNCWWHMPFNRSARVTATATRSETNLNRETVSLYFYIDYRVYSRPVKDIRYFHARFRETDPAQRGKPVRLVQAEGSGHFVGLVMGQRARISGWFGEGDDIITVDGKVSFLGTGTEDYFCDAWGFRIFSAPFHGVSVLEGREVGDRLSVYRFHIQDPIPFRNSFTFDIEHWPWITPLPNSGRDYFSCVGFWYQADIHKPWPRLERILAHEPWDPHKGRWHVPGAIEAEDCGVLAFQSRAGTNARPEVVLEMPNLSGDHMLLFDSGGEGWFDLAVPTEKAGEYKIRFYFVRAPEYGTVSLRVNGIPYGDPVDTYLRTDDLTRPIWPPKAFVFPAVQLKKGLNVLRFSIDSRNPESDGYKLGLDCLVLEAVGDR